MSLLPGIRIASLVLVVCAAAGCSDDTTPPGADRGGLAPDGGQKTDGVQPSSEKGSPDPDRGGTAPGGQRLFFLDQAKKVHSVNVDGSDDKVVLTIDYDDVGALSVSPDGKWLFHSKVGGDGTAVELGSGNKVTLAKPGHGIPCWAQDSSLLVTSWGAYVNGQIYKMPAGEPLLADPPRMEHAWLVEKDTMVLYANSNAFLLDLSTKQAKIVLPNCMRTSGSSDGKMMCAQKNAGTYYATFFDKSGNEKDKIALGDNLDIKPQQYPFVTYDGSKVIWGQPESGSIALYAMDLAAKKKSKIATSGLGAQAAEVHASWDGKYVVFDGNVVLTSDGKQVAKLMNVKKIAGFTK